MAVIVIKKGSDKIFEVTCSTCQSILNFKLEDIQSYIGKDIEERPCRYDYVTCPECGNKVIIYDLREA